MNGALEKLLPASQREMQTIDDRSHFLGMRRKYLAHGLFTPMSEMLNMLAYGKYIGLTAGNSSNAYSSEDKKTFYLNCRPILVSRFCKMVQELVAETSGSSDRTRLHTRGQPIRDQCLAIAHLTGTTLERCRRPSAVVNLNCVTNRVAPGSRYKLSYDAEQYKTI
jgi:hypothetical protein